MRGAGGGRVTWLGDAPRQRAAPCVTALAFFRAFTGSMEGRAKKARHFFAWRKGFVGSVTAPFSSLLPSLHLNHTLRFLPCHSLRPAF
jgi:hypothetical protein